jgi:2-isopropylmalate synthase
MTDRITIFDTTLRDGEQSPGFSMNLDEKVEFARQLTRLHVDVIEAGFPASSPGDFEAVRAVADRVRGPQIAGLARAREEDIDRCWDAVRSSARPRIHTFIATSQIHREKKLRRSADEVLDLAVRAIRHARRYTENVEFSTEDAARTERGYLCRVVEAAIDAGASTVNIPDTVGYSNPWEFGALVAHLFDAVPNIRRAVISVHCHNDLGLAVANSLAAVRQGARQIECTVNGIGERAGNASLEEIVMNLRTRHDYFGYATGIRTEQLAPTSRMLARLTGIGVQPNKAIVGANAFAHEAGIHQDGVLKDRTTYEIMTAASVGWNGHSMVLGKHSGRHAFSKRLQELGYSIQGEELDRAFASFKSLADLKKHVFDEDLIALVGDQRRGEEARFVLESLSFSQGRATVTIRMDGEPRETEATGDGALDAAFSAINAVSKMAVELIDYNVSALSRGSDAQALASVALKHRDRETVGRGTDTDVVRASVKAYLHALNQMGAPVVERSV